MEALKLLKSGEIRLAQSYFFRDGRVWELFPRKDAESCAVLIKSGYPLQILEGSSCGTAVAFEQRLSRGPRPVPVRDGFGEGSCFCPCGFIMHQLLNGALNLRRRVA